MEKGETIVIDLTIQAEALERSVQRAREKNVIIPTFKQMRDPKLIPDAIVTKLKNVGLWDVDPLNLYRIPFGPDYTTGFAFSNDSIDDL